MSRFWRHFLIDRGQRSRRGRFEERIGPYVLHRLCLGSGLCAQDRNRFAAATRRFFYGCFGTRWLRQPGWQCIAEGTYVSPGCGKNRGHMGVAGEYQHLSLGGIIGQKFAEHASRRRRPTIIEVHQCVVHHNRQLDSMALKITDQRQPQCQKDLLACASAETFGAPCLAVGLVHLQPCLFDRRCDRCVAAFCQS